MTVTPAFSGTAADAWWVIDEMAAVPAARRAAAALATELGYGTDRVGEVGIVVSELATNLVRHAGGGELVLRVTGRGDAARLRILAIDSGPGSRDIRALISDGSSTRGTLGIGLGACVRLSTAFDIYSVPALGTIVEVELGPDAESDADPAGRVADLTRPLSGDGPCGDAAAVCAGPGGTLVMVADGLGHGPLAAAASSRAAEVFAACGTDAPGAALERIHTALTSTRGAAVSVLHHDPARGVVRHAGVGNIVVRLVGPEGIRSLPSQPGIVGHRMPHLRELSYPAEGMTAVVMHSDGLTQRWSLDDVPGVLGHRPAVIGAAVLRAAATRRDDAGVLVLRIAP
jgi:anti-sigma regulatory factor (Ser/Thr protein kinase)